MTDEIQNRRGVKSKFSVDRLLIELIGDSDAESEEYNNDNVVIKLTVSQVMHKHMTKVAFSNTAHNDESTHHLHWDIRLYWSVCLIYHMFWYVLNNS